MWCLGLVAKDMVKLSKSNKLKFRSRILPYKKFNVELLQFGRCMARRKSVRSNAGDFSGSPSEISQPLHGVRGILSEICYETVVSGAAAKKKHASYIFIVVKELSRPGPRAQVCVVGA